MWSSFFVAVAVCAVCVFLPGYAIVRAFGVMRTFSLAFAPLFSVAGYVVLGLVYSKVGIASSWATLFIPFAVVSLVALAVGRFVRGGRGSIDFGLSSATILHIPAKAFNGVCLGAYLLFGIVFATGVFLCAFGSDPAAYSQQYDNVAHLDAIRAFLDSGVWSPFANTMYPTQADVAIEPLAAGSSFYPTAWYTIAALPVSALGIEVGMAENVANFVFVGLVFPASVFAFMRVVFDERPQTVAAGSVCAMLFSAFPWMLIDFGPLYPNTSSFCMALAVAAAFILVFKCGSKRSWRVLAGAIVLVGLVSVAFSQPNSVFTMVVLLAPFVVLLVSRLPRATKLSGRSLVLARVGAGAVAAVAIVCIWVALYKAPFLQSVITHLWYVEKTRLQALLSLLTLRFEADSGGQIPLALVLLAGVLFTLRDRRYLWLVFSFAIAGFIYVIAASSDGQLQHIFAGFWYGDRWRCAAMCALAGIPLASLGLSAIPGAVLALVDRVRGGCGDAELARTSGARSCKVVVGSLASVALVALCVVQFGTGSGSAFDSNAFAFTVGQIRDYSQKTIYAEEESSFVEKAKQVVGSDELVINVPEDGSAFSYPIDGLRTYYRVTRTYGGDSETPESKQIRTGLYKIATDDSVKQAVKAVGARYVLQLDQGEPEAISPHFFTYETGEIWQGIDSIRDDTPGFEVVLSEGDMRLYKITAVE